MKKVQSVYPFSFFSGDYPEMKAVPEDVFYEAIDGQLYSQFYKGQLIPIDVYNAVFSSNSVEVEPDKKKREVEKDEVKEFAVEVEKDGLKLESEPKRKRRKSIIKK